VQEFSLPEDKVKLPTNGWRFIVVLALTLERLKFYIASSKIRRAVPQAYRQCIQLLPARLTEKPKLHYLLRIIYLFPSCLWRGSRSVLQSQSCCIGELHSGLLPTKASCRVHRRFNYLLLYCTVRQEEVKSENCMFGSWSVTSIRLDRCIAPALHAGSSCSSFPIASRTHPILIVEYEYCARHLYVIPWTDQITRLRFC
jgi:hypothetical protein